MTLRPLPRAVLALSAGILLALRVPLPGTFALLAAGALAAFAILSRTARSPLAYAAAATAGLALGSLTANATRTDCRATLPDGASITVHGILALAPTAERAGELRLSSVKVGQGRGAPCAGAVRLRLRAMRGARPAAAPAGSDVVAWGRWLASPPDGRWPRPAERSGTFLVDSLRANSAGGAATAPLLAFRAGVQRRLKAILPRNGQLAEAMLLARKEGIDLAQRDRFARAGLAHLLAISGLHVGLIGATLLLLGRTLRLSPHATAAGTVAATIAYVLFLGAPPAAARAALQITLALAGRYWQRSSDPFSLLAAAALLLLVLDPLNILDPGFQLSFAGTAGIVALRRRMIAAIPERIPRAPRESVAVSLAATLATAPCTALHFGQIAPVGIVANLAAIPITGIAVPAIALALAVSTVSLPLGRFLAGGADLLLGAIDHTARAAAALPGGHLNVPRDAVLGWALALLLAAAVGRWGEARHRQLRPLVRRASAATAAFALLTLWPLAAARWSQGALEIHAIDVGQGDALAIRSPGGRWILVDAGPGGQDYDAGRARVVPFLLSRGVRRLDALILTHPDADHFGGAASVLEAFDVGAIVDPGMAAGKPFFRDLVRGARHRELRWIAARAGKEIQLDDLALVVLAPEERRLLDERAGTNEVSVAFRLEYGRFRALFLGDAPAAVEEELVEKEGAALRADVLKVAHHGSKTSTSEALLAAAEPRVAIISVGRRNRFGHPAPAVLERLNRHDVQILRTDREGTISLSVRPDGGIVVKTQR